ncbi:hypothetical protein OSTOST_16083 [Ostertagia ostertagi]
MLVTEEANLSVHPVLAPETKAVIANVKRFFAQLKEHLGATSRGTVFDSVIATTALACGVSENTVTRVSNAPVRPTTPRAPRRDRSRKVAVMTAMNNHGAVWGERIRRLAHEMFKEEKDVTIVDLHQQMRTSYPEFALSTMSLWRLMKGLGFSYKILKGQRYIFERSDLARRRSLYLRNIEEARRRGDCVVYMDETWVFEGMVKKRGWMDNNLSRFPSEETIQQYSCGKTAGKNKGKRGIVIMALCEGGIIPGCTRVLVCGPRTAQYSEMDHTIFEEWLRSSIPLMREFAAGRNVTLVLDNAPYHTRVLERVPTRSSTRQEIMDYLASHGIEVALDSTRASLLDELDLFVASRGGVSALRSYAAERICEEMGVSLLRLPPFHCFFNPVELCWSYLKHRLNKLGKPTDRLETVRNRAVEILGSIPRSLCEGWCWDAIKEEDSARMKEALDANNNIIGNDEILSPPGIHLIVRCQMSR